MEQKLIKKNFVEFIDLPNHYNIWTYIKPHAKIDQVSLDFDYNRQQFIFSFPLKDSNSNNTIFFDNINELTPYVKFIVCDYLI